VPSTHNSYLDVLASLFHLLEEQGAASDEEEEEADGDGEKEGGKGSKSKGDGKVAAGGKAAGGKVDSGKDGGKAGDGKWKRGGQQHTGRSAESETAHLLSALVVNLEARGGLYREEELQHLFLMNNTHYLVQSAADWYRWHVDSLNHPLSQARKEGARDLTAAMADLRDGHIVQLHATAFQSRALAAVMGALTDEPPRGTPDSIKLRLNRVLCPPSPTASHHLPPIFPPPRLWRFNGAFEALVARQQQRSPLYPTTSSPPSISPPPRLRKFNGAFEALVTRQRRWCIPDEVPTSPLPPPSPTASHHLLRNHQVAEVQRGV
ncbi:unnamed protein product, partial [Closterium sp. NIES-54]